MDLQLFPLLSYHYVPAGLGVRRGLATGAGAVALLRGVHGGVAEPGLGGRHLGQTPHHRLHQPAGGRRGGRVRLQRLLRHVRRLQVLRRGNARAAGTRGLRPVPGVRGPRVPHPHGQRARDALPDAGHVRAALDRPRPRAVADAGPRPPRRPVPQRRLHLGRPRVSEVAAESRSSRRHAENSAEGRQGQRGGRDPQDDARTEGLRREAGVTQSSRQGVTTFDLFKTPVLRRRFLVLCVMWVAMTVAYDGFMRNTANIGYDAFLSFTIAGLLEFPADLLMMVTTEWLGRRHTTVGSLVLCGVSALCIAAIPEDNTLAVMVMAFVGRFLITVTMNVGHQYPVEVLPTVARGQGMGTMQTLGFASAFASPYIVYLSKYSYSLPYVIMGVITVIGGLTCLLLPETLHENLPDTLEDGETFFGGQTLCYNPCGARKEKSAKDDVEKGVDNPAFETTRL
nr:solute carrier family 22 member 1-like [Penaeus vannamei]